MSHWWVIVVITCLGMAEANALPMKSHRNPEELMQMLLSKELGRNNALEIAIIDALEGFRQTMVTGTSSIPILDPLRVSRVYVDDAIVPIPGARLELNDLVVSKLSTFVLNEVTVASTSIILQRYSAQIEIEVPEIEVTADAYDLFINVMGFNLFGKGDATISLVKPWVRIDTEVNIRLGLGAIYLNIRDLRVDFGISDIQFGLTGMFNDPSVDGFVNAFIRSLVLELLEFYSDYLSELISPIARDLVNDLLSDVNLIDLLG